MSVTEEYIDNLDFLFEDDPGTDLSCLNDRQREAVEHREGPCLVLAGAGSGKTRVLTYRIARLVESGIRPDEILACTFSRKAADEMKERLAELLGDAVVEDLAISTFHSVCYGILREEYFHLKGYKKHFSLLTENRQKYLAKDILQAERKSKTNGMNWDKAPGSVLGAIGYAKNCLFNFREPGDYFLDNDFDTRYFQFYEIYEQDKKAQNVIDFDDMLYLCWKLFDENPAILSKYQNRWKWILIDETQDTNLAQYEIARMLAEPERNIFVVGDDCQSIYGFRGACPETSIHGFTKMYSNGRVIKLEQNYRSGGKIIEIANKLHLENPYEKVLLPTRGDGFTPFLLHCVDVEEEASYIADEIELLAQEGMEHKNIAVLYRTNSQSEAIETEFIRRKIPYEIHGGLSFYRRKEIRDMISYLQLIEDPKSEEGTEALWRVWNIGSVRCKKPTHFFGKKFQDEVLKKARDKEVSPWEALTQGYWKSYQLINVEDLKWILDTARDAGSDEEPATVSEMIASIRKTVYDRYLKSEEETDTVENPRFENLNRLMEVSQRFDSVQNFLFYVQNIANNAQKMEENGKKNRDSVQIMTIHRSKGLEFPVVFGIGISQGILPHSRSEDIGEERRICYVLVTRAKDRLYLSYLMEREGKSFDPSPFLVEMGLIEEKKTFQENSDDVQFIIGPNKNEEEENEVILDPTEGHEIDDMCSYHGWGNCLL